MSRHKIVYVLENHLECLGVYTSMKHLAKGVDYWMKEFPRNVLSWKEWQHNYIYEAFSWEWAYIPLGTKPSRFSGGASIPLKKYWGHNLVDLSNRGIRFFPDEKDTIRAALPSAGEAILVPNQP